MSRKSGQETSSPVAGGQLVELMSAFGSLYVRFVRSCLPESEGMTVPRATMLGLLASKGERIVMGELGELLGMSPRNVTVLVDGLEKEQLLRRVPHERDRRATYIEITEKGKGVAASILGPHKKAIAGLYDALTAKERQELAKSLSKLLATLRSLPSIAQHEKME